MTSFKPKHTHSSPSDSETQATALPLIQKNGRDFPGTFHPGRWGPHDLALSACGLPFHHSPPEDATGDLSLPRTFTILNAPTQHQPLAPLAPPHPAGLRVTVSSVTLTRPAPYRTHTLDIVTSFLPRAQGWQSEKREAWPLAAIPEPLHQPWTAYPGTFCGVSQIKPGGRPGLSARMLWTPAAGSAPCPVHCRTSGSRSDLHPHAISPFPPLLPITTIKTRTTSVPWEANSDNLLLHSQFKNRWFGEQLGWASGDPCVAHPLPGNG